MTATLLEQIAPDFDPEDERRLYPTQVLKDAETALLLFGAAFRGRNDGYWFLEAGLKTTCVDVDEERLVAMKALYPDTWEFVLANAFYYVHACPPQSFDVVSVDPPTNLSTACLAARYAWFTIARKAVVLGLQWGTLGALDDRPDIEDVAMIVRSDEFEVTELRERNARSIWVVMERRA